MGKVLLIGGSPMTGKTSAAVKISSYFQIPCISTDDIGEILQTAKNIDPMKGLDYLDYYSKTDENKMFDDMIGYHRCLEKAVLKMIDIHSQWGNSVIIEGYALYPHFLGKLNANTDAVWLSADEQLLETRVENSRAFKNASPDIKEKYLKRSVMHNRLIQNECSEFMCKTLKIDRNVTPEMMMKKIVGMININF